MRSVAIACVLLVSGNAWGVTELYWATDISSGTVQINTVNEEIWYNPGAIWGDSGVIETSWDRGSGVNDPWRNSNYWEDVDADTVRLRINTPQSEEIYLEMPAACRVVPPSGGVNCALSGTIEIIQPLQDSAVLSRTIPDPVDMRGDLNGDSTIDAADATLLFAAWGSQPAAFDITEDGLTDAADAGIMFANWTGDAAPVSPVPEPVFPAAALAVVATRILRLSRFAR